MTALTEAHLHKLTDEDLRSIALRILTDAASALDPSIEAHDLANHPELDPAPVHRAANWIHEILTNPDNGYSGGTWGRHRDAVMAFRGVAYDIGEATTGNGDEFPPWLNAAAVGWLLFSVDFEGGTAHRPIAGCLRNALDWSGGGFIPGHETPAGYVLKAICGHADPRLPALAESYLQSGLHVDLRPAIDEATQQLAHLDELTELTRH